jgi:hypothetical protein
MMACSASSTRPPIGNESMGGARLSHPPPHSPQSGGIFRQSLAVPFSVAAFLMAQLFAK